MYNRRATTYEIIDLKRHGDEPICVSVDRGGILLPHPDRFHVRVVIECDECDSPRDRHGSSPLLGHPHPLAEEEDGEGEHHVARDVEGCPAKIVRPKHLAVITDGVTLSLFFMFL